MLRASRGRSRPHTPRTVITSSKSTTRHGTGPAPYITPPPVDAWPVTNPATTGAQQRACLEVPPPRMPRTDAPVLVTPSWHQALAQLYYHLASGNDISQDYADRVSRLLRGAGDRGAVIRWWWVLRGECRPYNTTEAETLLSRNLWKQALYTVSTAMPPAEWRQDAFLRVTLKTAALALANGQWRDALYVVDRGLTAAKRCLPPKQQLGLAPASPPGLSRPRRWACDEETQKLQTLIVANAVAAVPDWSLCLAYAARFSTTPNPVTARVDPATFQALERVWLYRASLHPTAWVLALQRIDTQMLIVPPRSAEAAQVTGLRRVDANIGLLGSRIAAQRLGHARRAELYVDALRRRGIDVSIGHEKRCVSDLLRAKAPLKSIQSFRRVAADGRRIVAELARMQGQGNLGGDGDEGQASDVATTSASLPAPEQASSGGQEPAANVQELDAQATDCAMTGDWEGALRLVARLQEIALAPVPLGRPITDRVILTTVRDISDWRDALHIYGAT
jgi:hypothetical protein